MEAMVINFSDGAEKLLITKHLIAPRLMQLLSKADNRVLFGLLW